MNAHNNDKLSLPSYTMNEVYTLIQNNPEILIIDVRPEEAYDAGHLPRALSRPAQDKSAFVKSIENLDHDKTYLTYCGQGKFALKAAHYLQELGFKNVVYAKEGFSEYAKAYGSISEK